MTTPADRYHCHNRRPMRPDYLVQAGWQMAMPSTLEPRMVRIPHTLSTDCRYVPPASMSPDPKCAGCCHERTKEKAPA
jgi:hypothetical protein